MEPNNNTLDLSVLLKRWKLIAACALLGLVLAYCYTAFFSKPTYTCLRAYIINNSVAYSNDASSRTASATDIAVSQDLVETYSEYMRLPLVLKALAEYITETTEFTVSAGQLSGYINIRRAGKTGLMQIEVTTDKRELSSAVSAAIDSFIVPNAGPQLGYAEIRAITLTRTEGSDGTESTAGSDENGQNAAAGAMDFGVVERTNGVHTTRTCAFGLIVGAAVGAAIALLLYVLNYKIGDEEEFAKKIDVPVLGNIPDPRGGGMI